MLFVLNEGFPITDETPNPLIKVEFAVTFLIQTDAYQSKCTKFMCSHQINSINTIHSQKKLIVNYNGKKYQICSTIFFAIESQI